MNLLGIDIGTTHIKAGLFEYSGKLVRQAIHPNRYYSDKQGYFYYKPEEVWETVIRALEAVSITGGTKIAAVGITSMAESGLLIDHRTGEYRSPIIPWFDQRTEGIAGELGKELDALEHFKKTGIRNSYKHGLAKLLWLKQEAPDRFKNAKWLSASDFIAYKLTGETGTDYSLAARTFAFRIDKKEWDFPWIRHFGLDESLFPEARPSGAETGKISSEDFAKVGLAKGTPVAVSGHDHVCASLAVGAVKPGIVSDSIGTAETIVGTLAEKTLSREDYDSGFSFGCHVLPRRFFWMGGIQSSGGSVEWIRKQLADEQLSYEQIESLLNEIPDEPTGILYYPYLTGSGSPRANARAKGAFIGLKSTHRKGELLRGVLEGTAYEFEYMKRAIESLQHSRIAALTAVGGGTKNQPWMQIKADVSGCTLTIPSIPEATLLGAAVTAGLHQGVYQDEAEAVEQLAASREEKRVFPNPVNHQKYRRLFEEGYLPLQEPLRNFYNKNL